MNPFPRSKGRTGINFIVQSDFLFHLGNQDIQTTKQSGYDQKNRNNDLLGPKRCDQCNKVNFVIVWMHREIHNSRMLLEFRDAQRNAKINDAKINSVNLNKQGNSV